MSGRNNINLNTNGVNQFLELLDCPNTYSGSSLKYCQVNLDENSLIFSAGTGGPATQFASLTDGPENYGTANNQFLTGNQSTQVQWAVPQFEHLSDVLESYASTTETFELVVTNNAVPASGLVFVSLPDLASVKLPLINLKDVSGGYGSNGNILTSSGSGFSVQPIIGSGTGVIYNNNSGSLNTISNGSNNQVLTVVSGSPAWANLTDIEIPDPLTVNNINERTSGYGVTINTNTNIGSNGITLQHNLYPGYPTVSLLNTYIYRTSFSTNWLDSVNNDNIIGVSQMVVVQVGNQVTITVKDFASTLNALTDGSSYLVSSYVIPNQFTSSLIGNQTVSVNPYFGDDTTVGSGSVFVSYIEYHSKNIFIVNLGTSNMGFGSIGNGRSVNFNNLFSFSYVI